MKYLLCTFDQLPADQKIIAGGKGGALALLYQKGYPIPKGFIIMPSAFENDEMIPEAWGQVQTYLEQLRKVDGGIMFAVRSSAQAEDSSAASFAGQFDTVLQLRTDEEIHKAIRTVRRSRNSEEVKTYSEMKGVGKSHDMAVVVQQMVPADVSGVLFTADPVTGRRDQMIGNFIFGLGEKLVSGQATPFSFILKRQKGLWFRKIYEGPPELKTFSKELFILGTRLEKEFNCPQDIEWAIAAGKLYLLQSRPVTTLSGHDPFTGEWNDTKTGSYLWTNVNFGEAIPEVITPLSYSVQQHIYESWKILPGYQSAGNIGGRIYLNLSVYASALHAVGYSKKGIIRFLEGLLYIKIPQSMEIPLIRLPKGSMVSFLPRFVRLIMKQNKAVRESPEFLSANPIWCQSMQKELQNINEKKQLLALWHNEISPHLKKTVWSVFGSVTQFSDSAMKLRSQLAKILGPEDADVLISGLSSSTDVRDGSGLLASLGPVLGIAKVARGEMALDEYNLRYGHRGPNEFELSIPRPADDPAWIEEQLEQYKQYPIDAETLLEKKREKVIAVWHGFQTSHPRLAGKMKRRIEKLAPRGRLREAVRSEYTRDRWVARTFALRAGELTDLRKDIFFLTIEEVLDVLSGDETVVNYIPARKEAHKKYSALPAYPSIICGRFEPFQWAADPDRPRDIYDSLALAAPMVDYDFKSDLITGSPASAGRIEGVVHILNSAEQGKYLTKGEILVAPQTDIAWTPLFPRAGAIVTDVGAPLSHAAVIARELGIPAVVGCGNATVCLQTGDRVLVDGGKGTVAVLERNVPFSKT